MEEQSKNWERLFAEVGRVDQKIDALGIALSTRIDSIDQRLDGKIDGLRRELATQFRWTIGIMTALVTGVSRCNPDAVDIVRRTRQG